LTSRTPFVLHPWHHVHCASLETCFQPAGDEVTINSSSPESLCLLASKGHRVVLGYTEHLSPLLSLLLDEFTSLHHTLLTLLPPWSLCDITSHRVRWTWPGLKLVRVWPGSASSSVLSWRVLTFFPLKGYFLFLGVVPDPMWGQRSGMSMCTDCKALWGEFVMCDSMQNNSIHSPVYLSCINTILMSLCLFVSCLLSLCLFVSMSLVSLSLCLFVSLSLFSLSLCLSASLSLCLFSLCLCLSVSLSL